MACEKRCKGVIVDKLRGVYCGHIEGKMPKRSKQSIKAYLTDRIDGYWLEAEEKDREISEYEIVTYLKRFGLDPYEVELLMLRFIENKSMKDIVKEQGWVSVTSANYYFRTILKKLREGGFSFGR